MPLLSPIDLSVCLLTRNECANLEHLLPLLQSSVAQLGIRAELVIVDAGTGDGSEKVAERHGARFFVQRRPHYGGALREAFEHARGEYVLTCDADCSHPPELIEQLWNNRAIADVIIASRYIVGGDSSAPMLRKVLSQLLNLFHRRLFCVSARDLSSGFRLYRRTVLRPSKYSSEDFNILQEILIAAVADGYTLAEVPLRYEPRRLGQSSARMTVLAWLYLRECVRLWRLRNSATAADYDHRAFDSVIPLQRYWQRTRFTIVKEYCRDIKGLVLDIGCGSSRIIQSEPAAVAFDYSECKLRFLKKTNSKRVRGSTFTLPFADGSFQGAIHSQVIEHIPFDPVIYTELNRVLRMHGTLVIGTPDYGRPWWPILEYFYGKILPDAYADEHITHYDKRRLVETLVTYGFRVLDYRYICGGELIVKAEKISEVSTLGN